MPSQPRSRRFPRRDRSQHDPAGPARQSAQQSAQHPIGGTRRRTPRLVLAGVSAAALVAAVMALPGHAPTTPRVDLKELHRASSGGGMTLEGPRGERFDIHGAVGDGERDALSRAGTSASDICDTCDICDICGTCSGSDACIRCDSCSRCDLCERCDLCALLEAH